MGTEKKAYWIEYTRHDGRDKEVFIAKEIELENGYIKATGKYRRTKQEVNVIFPFNSIILIEEIEAENKEESQEEESKV